MVEYVVLVDLIAVVFVWHVLSNKDAHPRACHDVVTVVVVVVCCVLSLGG